MKRVQSHRTDDPRWAVPVVPAVVRPTCTGEPAIIASRCTKAPAWAAAGSRRRCWVSPGRRPSSAPPLLVGILFLLLSLSHTLPLSLTLSLSLSLFRSVNNVHQVTEKTPKQKRKPIDRRTHTSHTVHTDRSAIHGLGWIGFCGSDRIGSDRIVSDRWTGCYSLLGQRTTKR